jgi:hypothetical protein
LAGLLAVQRDRRSIEGADEEMTQAILTGDRDEVSETSHKRILFTARYANVPIQRVVDGVIYDVHTLEDWAYLVRGNVVYPWIW